MVDISTEAVVFSKDMGRGKSVSYEIDPSIVLSPEEASAVALIDIRDRLGFIGDMLTVISNKD